MLRALLAGCHLAAVGAYHLVSPTSPSASLRGPMFSAMRCFGCIAAQEHELGDSWLCNSTVCEETTVSLRTSPSDDPDVMCELQPGLEMNGQPVWACGKLEQRAGASAMTMSASVDVSDLGLTMDDMNAPLPELGGEGEIEGSGYESTSRVESSTDQGCSWSETSSHIEAILTIPGLRGQPAGSLAAELTQDTLTITAFGMAVWSCVLRGELDLQTAAAEAIESEGNAMQPVVRVSAAKPAGAPRWEGFIKQIGEDSILQ